MSDTCGGWAGVLTVLTLGFAGWVVVGWFGNRRREHGKSRRSSFVQDGRP